MYISMYHYLVLVTGRSGLQLMVAAHGAFPVASLEKPQVPQEFAAQLVPWDIYGHEPK